jgi:hypothetical protein
VAYGDGVFVTISRLTAKAAWSEDGGKNWEAATLPFSADWEDVTYGNGVFVAVGLDGRYMAWSEDGKTWKDATGRPSSGGWRKVAYGDGVFVAVADDSGISSRPKDRDMAAWSVDGKTWKTVSLSLPTPSFRYRWAAMAYGNGIFVAADYHSNTVIWSEDGGKSWGGGANLPSKDWWSGMAYGDGMFVAFTHRDSTDRAAWSEDGKIWEPTTLPSPGSWTEGIYGVCGQ